MTCTILTQDAVYHPQFIEIAKAAADGVYLTFGYIDESTPSYRAYRAKYGEMFGKPGAYSGYSYDAAYVLLTAIKLASSTDPAKIKAQMMNIDFQGATKRIKFRKNGDSGSNYVIWTVKDGRFKTFWNPATNTLY